MGMHMLQPVAGVSAGLTGRSVPGTLCAPTPRTLRTPPCLQAGREASGRRASAGGEFCTAWAPRGRGAVAVLSRPGKQSLWRAPRVRLLAAPAVAGRPARGGECGAAWRGARTAAVVVANAAGAVYVALLLGAQLALPLVLILVSLRQFSLRHARVLLVQRVIFAVKVGVQVTRPAASAATTAAPRHAPSAARSRPVGGAARRRRGGGGLARRRATAGLGALPPWLGRGGHGAAVPPVIVNACAPGQRGQAGRANQGSFADAGGARRPSRTGCGR